MRLTRTFIGLLAGALTGAVILLAVHFAFRAKVNAPAIRVDHTPVNRDASFGLSFAPVAKKAAPSIVNIYSIHFVEEKPVPDLFLNSPLVNDPVFQQFYSQVFGKQFASQLTNTNASQVYWRRDQELGSGIIVSPDGYILTANHVIDGADEIKVALANNKKEFTAKVIGKDRATDVAVLKIDTNDLPAITLADSDKVEVGDVVLAIGNPLGVGQAVTMGIVSALGRDNLDLNQYEDFIQTDAAINPGNSGGALVDVEGRLIGINTALAGRSNHGIGFAVPVNMARNVMDRLIKTGFVTRGDLGIGLQDVQNIDAGLAQSFGLPDQNGALVTEVPINTPAEQAGLKPGDVIESVNGKTIADRANLNVVISQLEPGTSVRLKIIRGGQKKTLTAILGQLQDSSPNPNLAGNPDLAGTPNADAFAGIKVQDLNMLIRQQLNAPPALQGALIMDVTSDSNYAAAGLQSYDVIVEINHHPVTNADDAARLYKAAKGARILIKVWRQTAGLPALRYFSVENTKSN